MLRPMSGGIVEKTSTVRRGARTLSLRSHLVLLVIGVLLPAVAFSAFIVRRLASDQRAASERRLIRSAHDLVSLIDRDMAGTMRALDTLAQSERLERGDLAAFQVELTRALRTQPAWSVLILIAPDGRQLVNTGFAYGTPLPRVNEPDSLEEIIRTHRPAVGSVVVGKTGGRLAFPVRVPVVYDGELRYVLTAVIEPSAVADLVASQRFGDEEWTRTVADARGTIVARTRDPERFVGKPATPEFYARVRAEQEGIARSTTLDGKTVYTGFSRGKLSDWTGVVVVPVDAIDGPARRSQMGLAAAGLAMLVLSGFGAFVISRRLARGIDTAAVAAESLSRGEPLPDRPSPVTELARLDESLRRSAELLASREQERDEHLARADAARAEAEAASRAKDEFLAMLGHELRNPLAPIRTGVHLLAALPPGDERVDGVRQTIARQVDHMTRLVDDLLDASRVARGKVELAPRPLDLCAVVRDVVTDQGAEFRQADVALDADIPGVPVPVCGDPTRLAQSLGNLLHNALKFTAPGGRVHVSLAADAAHAKLTVRDDGAGIAPELLPQLFQPFTQGPQSPARTHGGLGLGLALVRGFIALHNGTVNAHSDGPGKGATFTIRLPLHAGTEDAAAVSQPAPTAPPESATPNPQSKRRVLIVEDLRDTARTLKLLLSLDGHDVRTVGTAADALAAAEDFRPEVVVCDIGLPDMDGYELCRRIRQIPAGQSARLIALTGYGQADDVARATAAGFDLHLTKPVDVPTLRLAVTGSAVTVE